jgi:ribulose-5-phosphate 4-epimerase/fuculose-1-phosphate aldolase
VLSRESVMHLAIYDAFPEVNGVIHAHPKYANVFAATGRCPYQRLYREVRAGAGSSSPACSFHLVSRGRSGRTGSVSG